MESCLSCPIRTEHNPLLGKRAPLSATSDAMAEPTIIHVADHRSALDRVLTYYGLTPEILEVVPSVCDWCLTRGIPEENVNRMAKCFCNWQAGECRIVIRESFSQREFDNVNFAMEFRGFFDDVRKLSSMKLNLLHLLLHEIACHTLKTMEQNPRDTWAFAEMGKHDI
jgi:hypothetical protein